MRMVAHGGQCCGMRTICGFPTFHQRSYYQFIRMFTDFRDGVRDWTSPNYKQAVDLNGAMLRDHLGRPLYFTAGIQLDFQGTEISADNQRRYENRLIEVVLTDSQLRHSGNEVREGAEVFRSWLDVLLSLGFRRVSRFRNSNSGSYCTVFHFVRTLENNWEEPEQILRPTVVFTYYRKVYASGNVGLTMYPTIFEAFNGHRGRDPRVNKYEVLSDASVRVTERLTPDAE